MAMALPIAMFAASIGKSLIDSENAKSGDEAARQAGAQKLAMMQQGARQLEDYRQGLQPQMRQAMQNRMGAYGGANNVLSQMYGGHAGDFERMGMGNAVQRVMSHRGNPAFYGQLGPGGPGGPVSGRPVNLLAGPARPPSMPAPNIGFGGEVPPPPFRRM